MLDSGVSEPTFGPVARRKNVASFPRNFLTSVNYHLRNSISALDSEGLIAKIKKNDSDWTAIIGVDGSGAIQNADAMLERGDMGGCAVWKRIVQAVEEIAERAAGGRSGALGRRCAIFL